MHLFSNRIYRRRLLLPVQVLCLAAVHLASARGQAGSGGQRGLQLPLSTRQPGGATVQQNPQVPSGSTIAVQVQTQGAYAGSVEAGDSRAGELPLSLAEAISLGLRWNLGTVTASNVEREAVAQKNTVRSALLPNVNASVSETAARINLAAQGFSASTFGAAVPFRFPSTAGPFHYYDLHGSLQQTIFDLTAIENLRSQHAAVESARDQARQSREEVVLAVTGVYLQLMADTALLDRQNAEVRLAEASYRNAKAQVDAGNKAALEASRSLVELQTEQQRLHAQEGQVAKRRIQLARLIGLSLRAQARPTGRLLALATGTESVEALVERAWAQRSDLRAASESLREAQRARRAAGAERVPSIGLNGSYGVQGTNPNHGAGVFQAQLAVTVPIFQGGRIEADILHADAVVAQRTAELADERRAVEADIRTASIDRTVADQQVTLAQSNRDLAAQTLQQSQDRFAVGVTNSVEVVNAQQALAAADHDVVSSLFAQHMATVSLAHATGEVERDLPTLFEGGQK